MSRSPREKKRLDLAKQTRGFSEYAHAMRHGKWRRTKRRPAQKAHRQAERRALQAGDGDTQVVRPRIGKWGALKLRAWIERQATSRRGRAGRRARKR